MEINWSQLRAALSTPLALTGYAAWLTVWLVSTESIAKIDVNLGWLARGALLAYLIAFIVAGPLSQGRASLKYWVAIVVMGGSALLMLVLDARFGAPVLLAIGAAILAVGLPVRTLFVLVTIAYTAVWSIMFFKWRLDWQSAVLASAGITCMEIFAAIVMRAAARAEATAEHLRLTNAELVAARALLEQGARNDERLRVSRNLHDIAGHGLTALKLNLAVLSQSSHAKDVERISLCISLVDDLMQKVREVVQQTRDTRAIDLEPTLQQLAAPFPQLKMHLAIDPGLNLASIGVAETCLRVVQEGLTNAARHSNARNVWAVLQREREHLRLQIRDDGRVVGQLQPGHGLCGMRDRLLSLQGSLEIKRTPTGGLWLDAVFPVGQA